MFDCLPVAYSHRVIRFRLFPNLKQLHYNVAVGLLTGSHTVQSWYTPSNIAQSVAYRCLYFAEKQGFFSSLSILFSFYIGVIAAADNSKSLWNA